MDVLRLMQIIMLTIYTSTGFFMGMFCFIPPIKVKKKRKKTYIQTCVINCISILWLSFIYMNWIYSGWYLFIHFVGVVAASICIYRYVRDEDESPIRDEEVNANLIIGHAESFEDKVNDLAEKGQKNNIKEEFQSLLEEGYNIGVLDENFIKRYKKS